MDAYTTDIRALLAEHEVIFVEKDGQLMLDRPSFANLEAFIGELLTQIDSVQAVVRVVGTAEDPKFRFSKKELKERVATLRRRLRFLWKEVQKARKEGYSKEQTSYDRQEVTALGIAVQLMEMAHAKAVEDEKVLPGGTAMKAAPDVVRRKPPKH